MSARDEAGHSRSRTLAAALGAPIAAIALGLALAHALPIDPSIAHAIGAHAIVPAWVALACLLPLCRDGRRAWAICAAIAVPSAVLVIA